eukprot:TRINITY_DN12986_c0_g1_i3.p1 TRINITY_DN12986_c0_g1~~TRINITY_DN12986_c0_g1_i3.p1  ORF type:complete len:185 (-),score=30.60 TRINITY_DN12986_c0_g1_i3:42-596(-)
MSLKLFLFVTLLPLCYGIDVVPNLNLTQYVGRWYQVYGDLTVLATFERNAYCVTADYARETDLRVSVLNWQRVGSPTGTASNITGFAEVPNPAVPAKLTVNLNNLPAGSYWVVALGPSNYGPDNLYAYAVVTDSWQTQLFVLVRDVEMFKLQYDKQVQQILSDLGFVHFWNKPIPIQHDGCVYH